MSGAVRRPPRKARPFCFLSYYAAVGQEPREGHARGVWGVWFAWFTKEGTTRVPSTRSQVLIWKPPRAALQMHPLPAGSHPTQPHTRTQTSSPFPEWCSHAADPLRRPFRVLGRVRLRCQRSARAGLVQDLSSFTSRPRPKPSALWRSSSSSQHSFFPTP